MPALGVVAVAAGLAAVAALGRARAAFGALIAALLLVPAPLVVPNGVSPLPTVGRVVLLAAAAGLAWRIRRGDGDAAGLQPTPVHAALAIFAAIGLVVGVGLATATTALGGSLQGWVSLLEQVAVFVVVVAAARAFADPWEPARIVAAVVLVLVGAALLERLTGDSVGQWWFADLPSQQQTDAAGPLQLRSGGVRVRGPAEFALELGWVVAALLPLLLAVAARVRGRAGGALTALALLPVGVVVLTVSRSAAAAVVVVLVAAAALVAQRRTAVAVAGAVVVGAVVVAVLPEALGALSLSTDTGSIAVRSQRLPEILMLAGRQPLTGLGLSGLDAFGLPTTDTSYLLAYAELGVVGLATLVSLLLLAVVQVGRAAFTPGPYRALSAAAGLGMVTLAVGAWTYDAFSVLLSARTFWVLAAIGTVAAERAVGRVPAFARWRPARLALPLGLGTAGALVAVLAQEPVVATFRFQTLTPAEESVGFDPVTFGTDRIGVVCTVVARAAEARPGVGAECRDPLEGAGIGALRLEGAAPQDVADFAAELARSPVAGLLPFALIPETPLTQALPTPWRTAPIWMGLGGVELALLLPALRRRAGLT